MKSLMRRRQSAAIVISCVALFMSLGGVGYAAISIPNNSVGTAQLKNNAVTNGKIKNNAVSYKKIEPGAVGIVRANTGQLQVRVSGTCATGSAIGTINQVGKVTCNNALPSEFGTTNNTATLGSGSTSITSVALPTGASYLAFANPSVTVTPDAAAPAQHDVVSCTLTVGSNTATRSITFETPGTSSTAHTASFPLQGSGPSGTGSVTCTSTTTGGGTAPAISVTSAINAIQTASNS
ncbi:MAG: hypothetical protein ACXVRM_10950 [Solirubrobacteraceae bacterium]